MMEPRPQHSAQKVPLTSGACAGMTMERPAPKSTSSGVPMNLLQAQLGHSSLATTDRYVRHIAPAQLVAAIRQREWSVD